MDNLDQEEMLTLGMPVILSSEQVTLDTCKCGICVPLRTLPSISQMP